MNELALYFGDDYRVNEYIVLKNLKLDDIIRVGEDYYFSTIHLFTTIPSDIKSFLYDNFQIIWEDLSDYECFLLLLYPQITTEQSTLLFDNLDFTKFHMAFNQNTEEPCLVQKINDQTIVFDSYAYEKISTMLRTMHGLSKKVERAGSKIVQKILIDEDRKKVQREQAQRSTEHNSSLLPLISSLVNCSDFKYGLNEIRQMPIYAFMDSISRIQIIRTTTALLQGCYSGMIDMKKINKNELNFMREIKK